MASLIEVVPKTKVCTECKTEKALSEFHKNKNYRLGVTAQCKVCRLVAVKRWRKAHPEAVRAAKKRYQATDKCKAMWKRARLKRLDQHNAYMVEYRNKNRAILRRKDRDAQLRKYFGITLKQYEKIYKSQKGLCAICRKPPGKRRLAVDHCHSTKVIRALLCGRCNTMIGQARENIQTLKRAIRYLEKHNGSRSPSVKRIQ